MTAAQRHLLPQRGAGPIRPEAMAWVEIIDHRTRHGLPITEEERHEARVALARSPEAELELKGSIAYPLR